MKDLWLIIKMISIGILVVVNLCICLVEIVLILSMRGEEGAFAQVIARKVTADNKQILNMTMACSGAFVFSIFLLNFLLHGLR